MNTSAVITLDTRKPKKDGTSPIILRIVHNRESAPIRTGVYISEKDWDAEKREVRSSFRGTESVTRLNNRLRKMKSEATDLILKLDEQKGLQPLTVYELRDLIEKKPQKHSFLDFTQEQINDLNKAKRFGNARSYRSTLLFLKAYLRGKDLTFLRVTPDFLKKLEIWHLSKGNKLNGLAVHMRAIRAIYNLGIKMKIVDKELYPFKEYTIQTEKTRKRAIPISHIQRIEALKLKKDHPLYHTRHYFLFSFYAWGMPFVDLAQLKVSDLIDGRIQYDRQKTGAPFNVKLIQPLQQILAVYLPNKKINDYIFPIVKREDLGEQYKDILWARARYNKKLKKLAVLCGIEENLTSYVSRHSFATRAKNLGTDTATISDFLGHTSLGTTQNYLDDLPNDLMDDIHEKIVKSPKISKGTK